MSEDETLMADLEQLNSMLGTTNASSEWSGSDASFLSGSAAPTE